MYRDIHVAGFFLAQNLIERFELFRKAAVYLFATSSPSDDISGLESREPIVSVECNRPCVAELARGLFYTRNDSVC